MNNNQQIDNNNQNNENQHNESEDNVDGEENQENEDQNWEQQYNVRPLTEAQMKEEINLFFNLYINPILVFGCLSTIALESNQIVFYNQMVQNMYVSLSLMVYFIISCSYFYLFFMGFKSHEYNWKNFRIINYLGLVFIFIQIVLFIANCFFLREYFDMAWTRMFFTLLILAQYTHIVIYRLYGQFDTTLPQVFNRIYFLVIPLTDYEKENSFASLSEIYLKLKVICQPLSLVYFLIQMIYHVKMFKWSPSLAQILFDGTDHQFKFLKIAVEQMKNIQIFSLLLICGLIAVSGFSHFLGIAHDHQSRLPYIIIFIFYQTFIITYKFYLSALALNGEYYNLEKILVPLFMITIVPLFCTLFIKRALIKLYRLPINDSRQMQQQQIELFSQYKLEYPRNFPDPPDFAVQIQSKQTKMYTIINVEQLGIGLILFIYQFVNINQLLSIQHQETIGLQIQGMFDSINDVIIYIFLIHSLIFQALSQTTESILNSTEYGVFSFLFIANYLIKLQWNAIYLMSMFIVVSYIMNLTETGAIFHIGPLLSLLWMLLIYLIKYGIVPSMQYEFAKNAKIQFHFGQLQARFDALYQEQFQYINQQINQPLPQIIEIPHSNSQISQQEGNNPQPQPPQNVQVQVFH